MRKTDLDQLLESAVAKALGVKMPRRLVRTAHRTPRKRATQVRHAA